MNKNYNITLTLLVLLAQANRALPAQSPAQNVISQNVDAQSQDSQESMGSSAASVLSQVSQASRKTIASSVKKTKDILIKIWNNLTSKKITHKGTEYVTPELAEKYSDLKLLFYYCKADNPLQHVLPYMLGQLDEGNPIALHFFQDLLTNEKTLHDDGENITKTNEYVTPWLLFITKNSDLINTPGTSLAVLDDYNIPTIEVTSIEEWNKLLDKHAPLLSTLLKLKKQAVLDKQEVLDKQDIQNIFNLIFYFADAEQKYTLKLLLNQTSDNPNTNYEALHKKLFDPFFELSLQDAMDTALYVLDHYNAPLKSENIVKKTKPSGYSIKQIVGGAVAVKIGINQLRKFGSFNTSYVACNNIIDTNIQKLLTMRTYALLISLTSAAHIGYKGFKYVTHKTPNTELKDITIPNLYLQALHGSLLDTSNNDWQQKYNNLYTIVNRDQDAQSYVKLQTLIYRENDQLKQQITKLQKKLTELQIKTQNRN